MHDPTGPDSVPDPMPEEAGGAGDDFQDALLAVGQVISWYTEQILAERRRTVPDEALTQRLKAERSACVADRDALREVNDREVARIAAVYAARIKELEEQ
jgi:hypothetical protein